MTGKPMLQVRQIVVLAMVLCSMSAVEVAAQTNIWFAAGASTYGEDEFCLDSEATLTSFALGVENSWLGGEAEYNNSDWPWPNPGTGDDAPASLVAARVRGAGLARQQGNYLTHGNAFRGTIKLFALPLLRQIGLDGLLGNFDGYVRPYVGVGVQFSTDGNTGAPTSNRPLPVFAIQGGTNIFVTYGVSALLPAKDTRLGLIVGYRGATMFANDVDVETNTGDVQTVETGNLRWGQWSAGLRVRL
jgi:hypothetical protein